MHYYPLTHAQMGIMTELMQNPGSMHYNLPLRIDMSLDVDVARFIDSAKRVFDAHPVWKSRITVKDGSLCQYYDPSLEVKIAYVEMSEDALQEHIDAFVRPFDPFSEDLVRLEVVRTAERIVVLLDVLHTLADGMSLTDLVREVGNVYCGGEPLQEKVTVFEHALAQADYDRSEAHNKVSDYYKHCYHGKDIPFISNFQSVNAGRTVEQKVIIERSRIDDFLSKEGLRIAPFLNAAYCILNSVYTRSNSVSYSTILHGRDRKTMDTHGSFITTVPFYVDIDPRESVKSFIGRVGLEFMGLVRRSNYSFMDFVRNTGFVPETIFSYQGPKIRNLLTLGEMSFEVQQMRMGENTKAPLSIVIYETDTTIEIWCECSGSRFPREFVLQYAQSYANILSNIIDDVISPVGSIGVLTPQQSREMVNACTTAAPSPSPFQTVLEAVEAQAAVCPDKVAIASEHEKFTYRQISKLSDRIASALIRDGFSCGARIPLETSREAHSVLAMLGIMKAGMSYIPIDPSYPEDWKNYAVENSGAERMLADAMVLEMMQSDADYSHYPTRKSDAAYMIYTSGSLGKPKGVIVSHKALWAFVMGIRDVLGLDSEDRISCHSSFSFDASVEDIYPVLTVGGTLFIVPEALRKDVSGLSKWLISNNITGGNYTTRLGQMLMDSCDLPTLRYIVLGGEKMTLWPKRARKIATYNTYGPTEFTVDATFHRMNEEEKLDDIPIGCALPGMTAVIADHNGNLLPYGVAGEIVLSGAQLSDGYHALPQLTESAFPLSSLYPEGRYYRSGDIGVMNSDSTIYFLRRDDTQVKVSGFRIELSEIDKRVAALEGVKECKTTVRAKGTLLCCYYVGDEAITPDRIRESLLRELPAYMVPHVIERMESLPLGAGGKLDLDGLPEPQMRKREDIVMPETDNEVILLDIVSKLLSRDDIGVTDDLTLLGISSLQIMEMVVKACESGVKIDVNDAYGCRSIRELLSVDKHESEPYWFNPQDAVTKPLAVFVSGLTSRENIRSVLEKMSDNYAVWVIPAIETDEHLLTVDKMIDCYYTSLPDVPEIIAGHSFGGELAYMLALRIEKEKAAQPQLLLLDTTHHFNITRGAIEKFSERLPQRLRLYMRLHDVSHCTGYNGPVCLYSALNRADAYRRFSHLLYCEMSASENIKRWKAAHGSNLEIISLECTHENICNFYIFA